MKKMKVMTSLLTSLIILGTSTTTVFANTTKSPSQMAVESKMNTEVLYVVEKDKYHEALTKNVLSVEIKNNILSVNTEDIQADSLEIINSASSYFTLGNIKKGEVLPSYNIGGNIFYEEEKSFINLSNIDTEKDIIITNEESMVDVINATQIGSVEDRNLLLIKDNRVNNETITFLSEHGQDKNILFVEGELGIPSELRNYILQLAGSAKYEIDTYKVSKIMEEKKVDLVNFVPEKIPGNNLTTEKKVEKISDKSKEITKVADKLEESTKVFDKLEESVKDSTIKTSKQTEEAIENNTKMISYEEAIELDNYDPEAQKTNKFIKTLQDSKDIKEEKILIQNNEEIRDNEILEEHVSLNLIYANPLSIHNYVPDSKEVYVTSKSTSSEIIYSVMEGDYGTGEEQREKLEKEGYNYEEIQVEVEQIVAEREAEIKKREEEIRKRNEQIEKERKEKERKENATKATNFNNAAGSSSSSELTSAFLNEALKMQGWDYSQPNRWANGQADCSSLVIRALINTGYTNNHSNMTTRTIMDDSRFYEISMSKIRKGDILWYSGHMEIYMGGDTTFGAFRPGKKAGYASGVNRFSRAFRLSGN